MTQPRRHTVILAIAAALALIAVPVSAGYTVGKSVCTAGLVSKGACTVGQQGNWVNTAGRSTLHFSLANADLVELRDALCPTPPPGETQNDCAARLVRQQLERWIAEAVVADACSEADLTPDVD